MVIETYHISVTVALLRQRINTFISLPLVGVFLSKVFWLMSACGSLNHFGCWAIQLLLRSTCPLAHSATSSKVSDPESRINFQRSE